MVKRKGKLKKKKKYSLHSLFPVLPSILHSDPPHEKRVLGLQISLQAIRKEEKTHFTQHRA